MKIAGMHEANFEALTIHAIVDGTAKNRACNAFRTSLSMFLAGEYPKKN